jgi:uncharacterized protein
MFLILSLTSFIAHILKGLTGFGSALLMVPIFTLFMPLSQAVHVITLPLIAANLPMALSGWGQVPKRLFIPISISFALGIGIASNFMTSVPEVFLQRTLGAVLLVFSVYQLLGGRDVKQSPRATGVEISRLVLFSFVSGVIGGFVGAGGIPMVIYLGLRYPKDSFRHLANYTFFLGQFVQITVFALRGYFTPDVLQLSLWLILPTLLGFYTGTRFAGKLGQQTFNRVVGLLLIVPGLNLMI